MERPKKDKPLSGKERNVKFNWSLNKGGEVYPEIFYCVFY